MPALANQSKHIYLKAFGVPIIQSLPTKHYLSQKTGLSTVLRLYSAMLAGK
jgi:hypothetical protein